MGRSFFNEIVRISMSSSPYRETLKHQRNGETEKR
nr:MAG TPA: hypothetical protein [Bacteriophage sp.]